MRERVIGLSRDMIIHPGETLNEILEDRGISQNELAVRVGASATMISNIINGSKGISAKMALKLEYALDINSSFWMNQQSRYESEIEECESANSIEKDEYDILKKFKEIINYLKLVKIMHDTDDKSIQILELRKVLLTSNLTLVPKINEVCAYRVAGSVAVDEYVLYAWKRLCEMATEKIIIDNEQDVAKLASFVPKIKNVMFSPTEKMCGELQDLFSQCGIAFAIVKHFKGAPVQGYIRNDSEKLSLCMTIRQANADIFWFTLFHEIGHIINGDVTGNFIDYTAGGSDKEILADKFASDVLVNPVDYAAFKASGNYSLSAIKTFAQAQQVQPYCVIGRLEKEKVILYTKYPHEKTRYKWATT